MQNEKSFWKNPGKNCGACGLNLCSEFEKCLNSGEKEPEDCPFYTSGTNDFAGCNTAENMVFTGYDVLKKPYDFVIHPLKDEPSARKIVLPFRPDLTEKMEIKKGDIVLGRPQGAGCPVQHVLSVIDADFITGVITSHVISPFVARENPEKIKDIRAYHIIGFEGIAQTINSEPEFGRRQRFLPGFCMMNLGHTGVVNLLVQKNSGLHVRVEDIRIL